jgi:hypothetical protein
MNEKYGEGSQAYSDERTTIEPGLTVLQEHLIILNQTRETSLPE